MKILAIEDNPADAEILRELLIEDQVSSSGLSNARTLAESMSVLSHEDFDFVILDLGLPDSQGIDTLRALRTRFSSLPIVVLTGYDDDDTGMLALREGAQDYLVKGQISSPTLARSIRYAHERNRIEQELLRKNEDLNALNEELTSAQEELRQTNDELLASERHLLQKNEELNALNEELTTVQEELHKNLADLINTEAELRKSENRLARSQEIARLGSWELDLVNNRLSWSDEVYRIFGLRPQEFGATYEAFLGAVHPDDRSAVDAAYSSSLQEGRDTYEIEHRVIRKDTGEIRYVHEKCGHERDENGKITRSVGMVHDITERRQMEEKLQTMLQRFYRILSNMRYGILLVTDEDRTEYANQAFCDLFGLNDSPSDLPDLSSGEMLEKIRPAYKNPDAEIARIKEIVSLRRPVTAEDVSMSGGRTFLRAYTPIILGEKTYGRLWIHVDITGRKKAEDELIRKNEDLKAAYEEITSKEDELRQNVEELSLREQELVKREADLRDALAEKEVLLAEIHHRVKNNLTAFISLLSLDGSYEETESGRALRKDLQNRARSMALIHETLYRTGNFSNVNMDVYLNNLVSQIAGSYADHSGIRLAIDVHDGTLDIARATTAGLIINELVTNSFKYAFPPGFDCMAVRGEPCTIRVSLARDDGTDVLAVSDNGCGLPEGLDPLTTKSLGLKLVTFLARHQLRAEIDVHTDRGTEFVFRLQDGRV